MGYAATPMPITDGEQDWLRTGRELGKYRQQVNNRRSEQMWVVGDWLCAGEDKVFARRKKASVRALAAELTGYSRHTLAMAVSLARRIPPSMRIDDVTWWHHLVVAKLDPEQRLEWLIRAAEEHWSAERMRREVGSSAPAPQSSRRPDRRIDKAVIDLVGLRRDEIPEPLLVRLRQWWRNEIEERADSGDQADH